MKTIYQISILLILSKTFLFGSSLEAKTLVIENWPFTENFKKPDVFVEKLFCPSLTELNLTKKASQTDVLLKIKDLRNKWVLIWPRT